MKRVTASIAACLVSLLSHTPNVCAQAQEPDLWPAITQTAKPWTRWWWPGSAVNEKDLTLQLSLMADAGLGGVEITPIYGARGSEKHDIPFLSDRWINMLEHAGRRSN